MIHRKLTTSIVATLAALNLALSAEAAVTYRKVALTGEAAPGITSSTFSGFTTFSMNSSGKVALYGLVSSLTANGANADGLWLEDPSLLLATQYDATASGTTGGATYGTLAAAPVLRDDGRVVFRAVTSTSKKGVWSWKSSAMGLVAVEGMSAPGLAGVTISALDYGAVSADSPIVNQNGEVVMGGTLSGTGITAGTNDKVILSGATSETLATVARSGDAAPGVSGGLFGTFRAPDGITSGGKVSFRADMRTGVGGVVTSTKTGIWQGVPGSLQIVARGGNVLVPGYTFQSPDFRHTMNAAGATVFNTTLSDSFGERPAVAGGTGTMALIARQGMTVPDLPGVSYSNDSSLGGTQQYRSAMSSSGIVVFEAPIAGTGITTANTYGWFKVEGGSTTTILRQGQQAPGLAAGLLLAAGSQYSSVFQVNRYGQVFLGAQISGTGVTSSNNDILIAQDQNGDWKLIAREGSPFTVAPGDTRTIQTMIGVSTIPPAGGPEDGRAMGWNDAGQAVFRLNFTDGSQGIFVATVYDGPPGKDWDEDGLPNIWETANQLDPNSNLGVDGRDGDFDLDGSSNWSEYVAGTLANDNQSFLAMTNFQFTFDGRMTFDFPALSSRTYQVWYKESLDSPVWLEDGLSFPGIDGIYTYYIFTPFTRGVYRIEARLP